MIEEDYLRKSRQFIQENKFEKAQIILRRALSEDPKNAKAIDLLGDLANRLGRAKEAVQRYEQASNIYSEESQFIESAVCLEKIRMIDQTHEDVFWRLADVYRFYGLPNRATKTILELCSWALNNKQEGIFAVGLRKIVESQPKNLNLRLAFVKILYSLVRTQEANDELRRLQTMAEEAQDQDILAEVNRLLPETDGGEELDPKSRIELGNLLYEIGSKDEAIVEFQKAVSDLTAQGDVDEAIDVLNRMLEIEPENTDAQNKLEELKNERAAADEIEVSPAEPEPLAEVPESDILAEMPSESGSTGETESLQELSDLVEDEIAEDTGADLSSEPAPAETQGVQPEEAIKMFEDLGKEIEGFIAAGEDGAEDSGSAARNGKDVTEAPSEVQGLEGQIADIEFLLKEAEAPSVPSFEVAQEFDNFRNNILWQDDDNAKQLKLAEMSYEAGLYETALNYVSDIKNQQDTWPRSLEIHGGSLVKLGRYSDAMRAIAPSLLLEEIGEQQKIELRYILASAYEGLGDFHNALRETERILRMNPSYKDVKEMYVLMGGKDMVFEEPVERPAVQPAQDELIVEAPAVEPVKEPVPEPIEDAFPTDAVEPARAPVEEPIPASSDSEIEPPMYPTIVEETPSEEKIPASDEQEKPVEKIPDIEEKPGENIAFL
jgi:tetratricopeptide (TPR) repeat protein